jgi:cytochrome c oxidase subunit 2
MKVHIRRLAVVAAASVVLAGCEMGPRNEQNTLRPEGPAAQKIFDLFQPFFWIAVVIGVGVVLATFYVALKFRDKGDRSPAQTHGNTPLEIGWTIIPALILVVMAVPTVRTIWDLAKAPEANAIKVEAVGKQWWWQFNVSTDPYEVAGQVDKDGKPAIATRIVTSGELHIPINRDIELNVKSCDTPTAELGKDYQADNYTGTGGCNVIHSFWIPSLNGKADAIPGRDHRLVLRADKPGTYLGQCAEYCGLSHANMRMRVIAQEPAEYEAWLANQKKGPASAFYAADGSTPAGEAQKLMVNYACTGCHVVDDPSKVGYGPNLTHLASRSTIAGASYAIKDEQGQIAGEGYEHLWRWIHNATDEKWGVPMEAKDCRFPTGTCVGMPNFSIEQKQTVDGKTTVYPAMTEAEAQVIADYLKELK